MAENEVQAKEEIREQYAASERRAMVLAGEIEEYRTQLEAAERARKAAESELHEASDRVNELSAVSSSFGAQKRKLENDIQAMQVKMTSQDGYKFERRKFLWISCVSWVFFLVEFGAPMTT